MEEKEERNTKEERRTYAIKHGKKYESIVCPLCLKGRVGHSWGGKHIFKTDPDAEVIQIRYGVGGRGCGGFYKNPDESIRVSNLQEHRPDIYGNLKIEIGKLHKMFSG